MCISQEAVEWMCATWIELDSQQLELAVEADIAVPIAASSTICQTDNENILTGNLPADDFSPQLEIQFKKSA